MVFKKPYYISVKDDKGVLRIMTKQELELRLGFELTQKGWEQLEKMYMGCDLDKDTFASLIKKGAKELYAREIKEDVVYRGVLIKYCSWMGMWKIEDTKISLFSGQYFDTLKQATNIIKKYQTR